MAHFAQLDENNTVIQVIVVNNSELESTKEVQIEDGSVNVVTTQAEAAGVAFCQSIFGADTVWKQTSYNGNFRGKYAAIGDVFQDGEFVNLNAPAPTPLVAPAYTEQVQVLATEQIQVLETAQLQALSTAQIQALSTEQISALGA